MDESFKESIITSIQSSNSKEEMFKTLYSSMEKLYETEINDLIKFSGGRYFGEYRRYRNNIHDDSDDDFDTDSDTDSDADINKFDSKINKNFYESDSDSSDSSESENESKEDIIAIPKQFGLLAYLIKEEIQKGNIVIMDCESCSAFTADDINGYLENGKKKLLISNPR